MVKVLLLDDEQALREEIADYLRKQAFEITEVGSIRQFRKFFLSTAYDVVIIDRALPDGDGLELVTELRTKGHRCGIVVLTARDSSLDRIGGYRSGADHYISKPVRLDELAAILQTVAWRTLPIEQWRLNIISTEMISPRNVTIKLTAQEFHFLEILSRSSPKSIGRNQLAIALGKDPSNFDPRSLDAMVMRLRKKVAEHTDEVLPLRTHHGFGYSCPVNLHTVSN